MAHSHLTVVVMTRNRPVLLHSCLRSIFDCQAPVPEVIVSDNSTVTDRRTEELREIYRFTYVRQSGHASVSDHHNLCLSLATTRWIMLIHDDDELFPDCLAHVESRLANCEDAAVLVGGLQYIDPGGKVYREWTPSAQTLRGEQALVQLGCDFHARSPNTIFDLAKGRQIGGFRELDGLPADYAFFGELAYRYGLAFEPSPVGRYRTGHEQITKFDTPQRALNHLRFCAGMAQLIRSTGCSVEAADQVLDQMAWGLFLFHAARWRYEPQVVFELFEESLRLSPQDGPMQTSAQMEYPILFWRPRPMARFLYSRLCQAGYVVSRRRGEGMRAPATPLDA
jgi:hypothetical protein